MAHHYKILAMLLSLTVVGLSPTEACNVPVFRFALEKWPSDPFEVLVFHRGQTAIADGIEPLLDTGAPPNCAFKFVDLAADPPEEFKKIFAAQVNPALPWMVVRFPERSGINPPVWAGPYSPEDAAAILDSPLRRELAKLLLAGNSAVWILLESGDKEKDDAAARLLESESRKLETALKLPVLTDDPDDKLADSVVPLKIAFSLLRLNRNDERERMLVQMLLHSEDDLPGKSTTMAFPVFGRGRVLYALVGGGITADNIYEAGVFLTGACSCQVKELNPGVDLLMAANWESIFGDGGDPLAVETRRDPHSAVTSPAVSKTSAPAPVGQLVPIPPGTPASIVSAPSERLSSAAGHADPTERQVESSPSSRSTGLPRNTLYLGIVLAGLLVIVSGAWAMRSKGDGQRKKE